MINVGVLAHVDAGKTTLIEAILYKTGKLRKTGRVDFGDSFLDNDEYEKIICSAIGGRLFLEWYGTITAPKG